LKPDECCTAVKRIIPTIAGLALLALIIWLLVSGTSGCPDGHETGPEDGCH
jgi:hypothetical protein